MTNLNIAVPADSKDTEFGTSDILLAKDVVAYLNALDSDISKELTTQTDKINKINESIKQLVDHNLIKIVTELPTTDIDKNCIYLVPNKDGEGNNVFIEYIYVEENNTFEEVGRIQAKIDLSDYYTKEQIDNKKYIHMVDGRNQLLLNVDENTSYEDDYSSIRMYLNSDDFESIVTPFGFSNKTDDGCRLTIDGYEIGINDDDKASYLSKDYLSFKTANGAELQMKLGSDFESEDYGMTIGSDEKFKISRLLDNTEGATITGVKSITAFADPSATKMWATDGSIADLNGYAKLSGAAFTGDLRASSTMTVGGVLSVNSINKYDDRYLQVLNKNDKSNTKVFATDGSIADLSTKANVSDLNTKADAEVIAGLIARIEQLETKVKALEDANTPA